MQNVFYRVAFVVQNAILPFWDLQIADEALCASTNIDENNFWL
jgi:hypothetical protein